MKKKIVLCMVMSFILLLSGCQKTPDKSSVVSKADGLDEELIAEPLKAGEKRSVDMPEHWGAEEKKSNDRVTISADLDLGKLETGNLPVVEIANHSMTQEELEKVVEYFSDGEELYVPQVDTKETLQKVKDRMTNGEGVYANPSLGSFSDQISSLDDAIKLAPEKPAKDEKTEVKFQKKEKDVIQEAATSWYARLGLETKEIPEEEVFFSADVGKDRVSHIEAECYNPDIANSSKFAWKTGTDFCDSDEIQFTIRLNEFNTDTTGYKDKFREILNQYQKALQEQTFSEEEGQKQAEKIMEDLKVPDMSLLSAEKTLWFPEEVMPDVRYGENDDFYWQADLETAKAGYKYIFTRAFGGIQAESANGVSMQETMDTYTSPFPVETVSITVTEDGVKTFSWVGMCEEVSDIAENVKLLPFEDIQKQLFDQSFYYYLKHGQPKEDTTNFTYKVTSARLGYTYVTAYNKPEDAWMVPAWFFEVMEGSGSGEDMKDVAPFHVTINAMDGGIIVQSN